MNKWLLTFVACKVVKRGMATSFSKSSLIKFSSNDGRVLVGHPNSSLSKAEVVQDFFTRTLTGEVADVKSLLAPTTSDTPTIICLGLNYRKHAEEIGAKALPEYPIVFMKTPNTITAHETKVIIPKVAADPPEVDFEVELAVTIGKPCTNATLENALSYVLGYTIANDVSARRWQGPKKGGGQWCRAKSFNTFLPLGPVLVFPEAIGNPQSLRLTTSINGKLMQDGNTSDMIFSIPQQIAFLSQDTTLLPGTIILTGTPHGVGFTRSPPQYLTPGDTIEMTIEKISTLKNTVVAAAPSSSSP